MVTNGNRGVLVHEWLSEHGGSEKVFDVLVGMFPDNDLYCLWSDVADRYPGHTLRESWLADTPMRRSKALSLPLMPELWRGIEGDYDWALVSSHLFAHHVSFNQSPSYFHKFVYVHSPARYLWVPHLDQRGSGLGVRAVAPVFRHLDRRRAQEAYAIAANSKYIAQRVMDCWEREAQVIHPPVEVERIIARAGEPLEPADEAVVDALPDTFILGASRLIPYKRLDLVIRTAEQLGVPAVIAGSGPELERLQDLAEDAAVPVTFVPRPSDSLLWTLYSRALAFVFPPVEDFGIMPVEALAAGCPVVVGPEGGAQEIVDGTAVGRIAEAFHPVQLAEAVSSILAAPPTPDECRDRSRAFSREAFESKIAAWVRPATGVTAHAATAAGATSAGGAAT